MSLEKIDHLVVESFGDTGKSTNYVHHRINTLSGIVRGGAYSGKGLHP